jgi:mannosyltransferase
VPVASLPIGIDTQLFHPDLPKERAEWRQRFQLEPDALVFLSGRQLGAIYRPAQILEAFARMPAAARQRSYLIMRMFGHSVGTSLNSLQQLTQALGIEQRVRWIGAVPYERQPGLFVAADFTVNFPQMDAFPVTILESLACGVPVLTNRLPAYESNGAAPYLTFSREDSVSALSATMAAALDDVETLHARAAQAREHVVRNFDERISAARLREIYDSVLLRHSARNRANANSFDPC